MLPELNGKLDGYAIRVPTINVSLVDLSFIAARDTTVDEVNAHHEGRLGVRTAQGHPQLQHGAAGVDRLQPRSGVVDVRRDADQGLAARLVKVSSWYDNEWGFSNRMLDTTVALMAAR